MLPAPLEGHPQPLEAVVSVVSVHDDGAPEVLSEHVPDDVGLPVPAEPEIAYPASSDVGREDEDVAVDAVLGVQGPHRCLVDVDDGSLPDEVPYGVAGGRHGIGGPVDPARHQLRREGESVGAQPLVREAVAGDAESDLHEAEVGKKVRSGGGMRDRRMARRTAHPAVRRLIDRIADLADDELRRLPLEDVFHVLVAVLQEGALRRLQFLLAEFFRHEDQGFVSLGERGQVQFREVPRPRLPSGDALPLPCLGPFLRRPFPGRLEREVVRLADEALEIVLLDAEVRLLQILPDRLEESADVLVLLPQAVVLRLACAELAVAGLDILVGLHEMSLQFVIRHHEKGIDIELFHATILSLSIKNVN